MKEIHQHQSNQYIFHQQTKGDCIYNFFSNPKRQPPNEKSKTHNHFTSPKKPHLPIFRALSYSSYSHDLRILNKITSLRDFGSKKTLKPTKYKEMEVPVFPISQQTNQTYKTQRSRNAQIIKRQNFKPNETPKSSDGRN